MWTSERDRMIGSSDVPAIIGVSPWASARDVQCRVLWGMRDDGPSLRMRRGQILESAVIAIACEEMGWEVAETQPEPEPGALPSWATDHADALLSDGSVLEVKCVSHADDTIPEYMMVQCLWHLAAHPSAPSCRLVRMRDVGDVRYDTLWRDDHIGAIDDLVRSVTAWYERHIVNEEPAVDSVAGSVARAAYRAATEGGVYDVIEAPDIAEWTARYAALQEQQDVLQAEAEAIRQQVAHALAEAGALEARAWDGTWRIASRRTTDWAAIAEQVSVPADLIAKHTKQSEYLTFRRRKAIGGKS